VTTRPNPDDRDEILTPDELRAEWKLESATAIYELMRSKDRTRPPLPGYRVGKYLRFRRSEVTAWFDARRVGKPKG